MIITVEDFLKVDIRVGKIITVENFPKAKKLAYKLTIDFGSEIGIKSSSAQITDLYSKKDLVDKLVVAVINFTPRQIADFLSEVLVLGVVTDKGVVLLGLDSKVGLGSRIS